MKEENLEFTITEDNSEKITYGDVIMLVLLGLGVGIMKLNEFLNESIDFIIYIFWWYLSIILLRD